MVPGIEKVVIDKPLVLLDGSLIGQKSFFGDNCYETRRYHDFERGVIAEQTQSANEIKELFRHKSLHTVSGVIQELAEFQKIVLDKIVWLNNRENYFKHIERENYFCPEDIVENISLLNHTYLCILRKASKRVCLNHSLEFQEIFKYVKSIAIQPNLKRDYSERYGKPSKNEKLLEIYADEELVAHAFYNSSNNIQSAILTSDGDISRIVKATQQSLDNGQLLKKLRYSAPIEVYYATDKTLELIFSSQELV